MSESQSAGGIHYDVSMDIKELLVGEKQVNKVMDNVEKSTDKATNSLNRLDKTASQVATAMKMPEINKLSRDMAQLSGKIGANSAATDKAMQSHNRFTGVLSTVSSQLGAGYVGNVGSATASLINHTKAAIEATQAELANAEANKKQAETYQASAAQMVLNAKEEKAAAQSAIEAAKEKVAAADSLTVSLEKQYGQLQQQVKIQRELLKDAEATYQIAPKAENYQAVVTARNKMMATEKKMQAIGNQIDKEQAAASLALQKAKEAEIAASAKVTAATALEQKAKATLTTTNEAVAAATAKATAATQAQSIAMNGLNGVMALLGGPTGLLLLAAAGVYALYDAMTNDSAVKEYNAKIDEMIKKLDTLTSRQAEVVASELQARLVKNNQEISKLKDQIAETKRMLDLASSSSAPEMKGAVEAGQAILRKLETSLNNAIAAQIKMSGELKRAEKATKENTDVDNERSAALEVFNSVAKGAVNSNKLLAKTIELGSPAAASMAIELDQLERQLSDSGVSAKEAELQVSNLRNLLEANKSMDFELMLQGIEENVQALKIEMTEGKDAAIEYLATVKAAQAGVDDPEVLNRYILALKEQYKIQTQISNSKKKTSGGGKKDKASEEIKRQQTELASLQKRFDLLSSGVGDVNKEMAVFEAVQKLGEKATQGQKDAVAKEASEIYDLTQKVNDFTRAQEATPELKLAREFGEEAKTIRRMFDERFIDKETFMRLGREATQAFEQGMTDIKVDASVSALDEARAKVDPIQALQNENTQKLALIKEYMNQKILTEQEGLAMMDLANKEYEQNRVNAMYDLWRNQSLGNEAAAAAFDSLAGNASNALTGIITQSMTAADAARSLGRTVLNSLINSYVQAGIEQAKAAWFGAGQEQAALAATTAAQTAAVGTQTAVSTAAAATTTAAWTPAAIMASIASMGTAAKIGMAAVAVLGIGAIAGKRKNGGNVKGGAAYEVGEENLPELMQIGNKLIAIPGNNGRVFSYDDVTGSAVIPKASTGRQYINSSDNNRLASNKGMQGKDGNSGFTVIINNTGNPMQVTDQREFTAQDGRKFIELWCDNFAQGLETRRVVNQYTTANSKAIGSR
ncbi:hypothetical protein [Providencia huaxiensis]|uniref:hypothetical protein n=1 Tax=Providencia huaxiensis TaxID=2027290 RepID=UPI0032DB03AE